MSKKSSTFVPVLDNYVFLMKKTLLILSFLFLVSAGSFAQVEQPDPLRPLSENVHGPVKQLKVIYNSENVSGGPEESWTISQYDVQGRLVNQELYSRGKMVGGSIYQYTDSNYCRVYAYDANKRIQRQTAKIIFDTNGRKIKELYSDDGALSLMESITYDSLGRIVRSVHLDNVGMRQNVETSCQKESSYTYQYDANGQLISVRHKGVLNYDDYITYMPNGDYKVTRKYDAASVKTETSSYTYNSLGQLEKIVNQKREQTLLSEYDYYGNWCMKKHEICNKTIELTTKREIDYYSPKETDSIYLSAEQQPEFPGGQKAMFQYIADHVICPISARENGFHGRAYCQFIVNKSGDLTDINVVRSCGNNDLDKEAVRVISSMPNWNPGKINGEPVRMKYTVPVSYKIEPASLDELEDELDETIYAVAEKMPEFPGGQEALFQFLSDNVKYPEDAQREGAEGRTICQFVVDTDGKIVDIEVVRSSGNKSLDAEAVRVMKSMPRWIPGIIKDEPVRVKYTVPVNFKLR